MRNEQKASLKTSAGQVQAEDDDLWRAANGFFPLLLIGNLGISLLVQILFARMQMQIPYWARYIFGQLFILVPALLYIKIFPEYYPRKISYRFIGVKDAVLSLLTGYAMVPMIMLLSSLTMLFSRNLVQESSAGLFTYPFLVQLICIAIAPALVEEFVFRGIFFHSYKKVGVLTGALASALLFGLFHLNVNQFSYALVMGVVFASLVEATGSMWASVLAHFAVNTYSIGIRKLLEIFGNPQAVQQAANSDIPLTNTIIQLVMLAFFAAGFMKLAVLMIRHMAERNGRLARFQTSPMIVFRNLKKVISWPVIIAAMFCVSYMILLEM